MQINPLMMIEVPLWKATVQLSMMDWVKPQGRTPPRFLGEKILTILGAYIVNDFWNFYKTMLHVGLKQSCTHMQCYILITSTLDKHIKSFQVVLFLKLFKL
jgi:hypothetical protein